MSDVHNEMYRNASVVVQVGNLYGDVVVNRDGAAVSADRPPLIVTAALTESLAPFGWHWIFDTTISDVPKPPDIWSSVAFRRFAAEHEVLAGDNRLNLLVEGTSPQAVVLNQLRIRVVDRKPGTVAPGVEVFHYALFASLPSKHFRADFDCGDVIAPLPCRHPQETADFPYVVHQSEPEKFSIELDSGDEDIEWITELDWTCKGISGTVRIDRDGTPFTTCSRAHRPLYFWKHDGHWYPTPRSELPRWPVADKRGGR